MSERQGRLRKWFGPDQEEVWRRLTEQMDARVVDGGFWNGDKVEATHGEWTITLDTYLVSTGKTFIMFTRMRAPYINPDGFRFSVSRAGMLTDIAKWFGMQDVTVGHEEFDTEFVIKGNSDEKLRALFANPRVRALISAQKDIRFAVRENAGWFRSKDMPEDADLLEFEVVGTIDDVARLKLLFELFGETLDQLCDIGSAYEQAPTKDAG